MFTNWYNRRLNSKAEKLGFKTDLLAINPLNKNIKVPVYFANFVLMDYGLGQFLVVLHDQRDLDFALKYNLKVTPVVKPEGEENFEIKIKLMLVKGKLFNSEFLNDLKVPQSQLVKKQLIILEEKNWRTKTNFRLKDWGISRQRILGLSNSNCL